MISKPGGGLLKSDIGYLLEIILFQEVSLGGSLALELRSDSDDVGKNLVRILNVLSQKRAPEGDSPNLDRVRSPFAPTQATSKTALGLMSSRRLGRSRHRTEVPRPCRIEVEPDDHF